MICKINENLNGFAQLVNAFVNIINSWKSANSYYNKLLVDLDETIKILDHIHKCHLHPYVISHSGDEFPEDYGIRSGCTNISCIDRLVRELMEVFDVDDNKLIYGKDFIFNPEDPNIPLNIKENQIQYEIRYDRLNDVFMSFNDYFSHFNISRRCLPNNPISKLVLQGLLGENPDNPESDYNIGSNTGYKPCSNKIYGKDFIIDPDDPDKPKELIELEKYLSINSSIKKIKYSQYLKECIDNIGKGLIGLDENGNKLKSPLESTSSKSTISQCSYVCTRLVAEWLHTTDIDGNGKIYGKDFKICNDDPMKCRCLHELEQDLDWSDPNDIMTWDQFCKTFPNNNPDDRYANK